MRLAFELVDWAKQSSSPNRMILIQTIKDLNKAKWLSQRESLQADHWAERLVFSSLRSVSDTSALLGSQPAGLGLELLRSVLRPSGTGSWALLHLQCADCRPGDLSLQNWLSSFLNHILVPFDWTTLTNIIHIYF